MAVTGYVILRDRVRLRVREKPAAVTGVFGFFGRPFPPFTVGFSS